VAFYGALYLAVDYDPFAALQRAIWANNELVGTGHGTFVQYVQVSLSNLFAFLFGMGFLLVAVWLLQVKVAASRARAGGEADLFVLAFPISLSSSRSPRSTRSRWSGSGCSWP
jgi:hypothetical protein